MATSPRPSTDELDDMVAMGETPQSLARLYGVRRDTIVGWFRDSGRNPDGTKPKPVVDREKRRLRDSDSDYRPNYIGGGEFRGRLPGWEQTA